MKNRFCKFMRLVCVCSSGGVTMRGFSKYSNNFFGFHKEMLFGFWTSCLDTPSSFSKTKFAGTHVEKEKQKEGGHFVIFINNLLQSTSCAKCATGPPYSRGTCAVALENFLLPLHLRLLYPWMLCYRDSSTLTDLQKVCLWPQLPNSVSD